MGFLFLIFAGLLAMILIARFAARTRGKGENAPEDSKGYPMRASPHTMDAMMQKGLIALLLKKKVIGEEELLEEIQKIKNDAE